MLGALVMFGVEQAMGWRIALIVPGVLMLIVGLMSGNLPETVHKATSKNFVQRASVLVQIKKGGVAILMHAAKNYRVWILFGAYAACFGIEIFIHNIVAMYYVSTTLALV